ncbi:MAG: hypothetical protein ACLGIN_01715 [Candidatus Sericytochromatia bacterium]
MDILKTASLDDWELARRRAELSRLEADLADEERALAGYQEALAAFERRYFEAFAARYRELDELEAQIAEKAAALRPDDAGKRRKAERLRARADGLGAAAAPEDVEVVRPQRDDAIKAVYRSLSKLIHPDLAVDPIERPEREALMAKANAAYAAGDLEALTYLMGERAVHHAPAVPDGEEALSRVMRQIDLAARRVAQAKEARAAAEDNELARLMRRSAKAEEVGRDLFAQIAQEFEEAARQAKKRIKALDRRLAKPRG